MIIGRFLRSRLSLPKPNFTEFGQIAKVQLGMEGLINREKAQQTLSYFRVDFP
jgi:hypothetical protein